MLPRAYRLSKNKHFQYVYRKGIRVNAPNMALVCVRCGPHKEIQVGFSVSKKVGNSVTRNLVKRRMREAIRVHLPGMKRGFRLVFVARPGIDTCRFDALVKEMCGLLRKAKLCQPPSDAGLPQP